MCPPQVLGRIRNLNKQRAEQLERIADYSATIANTEAMLRVLQQKSRAQGTAIEKSQTDAQSGAMTKQIARSKTKREKAQASLKKTESDLDSYSTEHKSLGTWRALMKGVDRHRSARHNMALQGKGATLFLESRDAIVQTIAEAGFEDEARALKDFMGPKLEQQQLWARSKLTEQELVRLGEVTLELEEVARAHECLKSRLVSTPKWHIAGTHLLDFANAHGTVGLFTEQGVEAAGQFLKRAVMACKCVAGGDQKRVEAELRKLRVDAMANLTALTAPIAATKSASLASGSGSVDMNVDS